MWSQLSLLSLLTCLEEGGEDEGSRKGQTAGVNTEFPNPYGDPLEVPDLHVGGHLEGDRLTVEPAQDGGPAVSELEDISTDVEDEDFILIGRLWTSLCTDTEESVWT